MSSTGIDAATPSPDRRQFWQRFVAPAVLLPPLWFLLEALNTQASLIYFYAVSIGAIPLAFALVILPGWRFVRNPGSGGWWRAPLASLLVIPSAVVLLWGVYCAVWLFYVAMRGEL